ncbi:MAG: hypothetical protein U5K00_07815 [Melioribacteraceae bacterium]|nr:hypothetical protein [Melioribacteraceae bacterium]
MKFLITTSPNGWGDHEEIHLSVAEEVDVEGEGGRFAFYIGDNDNSISLYGGNYQLDTEFYHVLGTYKNRNGKVYAELYFKWFKGCRRLYNNYNSEFRLKRLYYRQSPG